jgi:uncharacterized membrane protein
MIELIKDLFRGFHLIHGVLILIVGVFNLWFWSRRRFWVPKYVHVIAGTSFAIAFFLGWMAYSLADINIRQKAIKVWFLITILFPTIVYFVFVFLGGVEARYRRRIPHANHEEGSHNNSNEVS